MSDPAPNEEAHADEDREARVILVDVHKRVPDGRQRRVILEGISLRLHAGELVVAQGPSGSGKSTLLSIVGAMSLPTSGSVIVLGEPVSELRDAHRAALRQRAVGFVFQELGLIGAMTLEENLLLPLVPTGGPTAEEAERIDRLLSRFGLSERRHDRASTASGGERQRLAVARALVRNPPLLVLDEPTAHLDADNTSALMKHLEDEKAAGRTVLVSTHDPRVSEHPAVDRVLRLEAGRLLA